MGRISPSRGSNASSVARIRMARRCNQFFVRSSLLGLRELRHFGAEGSIVAMSLAAPQATANGKRLLPEGDVPFSCVNVSAPLDRSTNEDGTSTLPSKNRFVDRDFPRLFRIHQTSQKIPAFASVEVMS